MNSSSSIAIVIPCFNATATLAATINSALNQDVTVDVIVIDDGSTDGSLALAREFEPNVRIFTGQNRGVSHARNVGISETTAEWILFLDADDLLEPATISKRLATAEASNADVVICDWVEMHDDGSGVITTGAVRSVDWPALEANAELAIAVHIWATTAAILYKRSIVNKVGGFRPDLPIIQDARFLFDAAYHGAQFAHSPHLGARYRVSPQGLSRRKPALFWCDVLTNGQQIEVLWRAIAKLSARQQIALAGIYNHAARGLFASGHPDYFEAVESQRRLEVQLPLHPRLAVPLARITGLRAARHILKLMGR